MQEHERLDRSLNSSQGSQRVETGKGHSTRGGRRGRDRRFIDEFLHRKIDRNKQLIDRLFAEQPDTADCTDDEFLAHHRRRDRALNRGHRLLKLANRRRQERFSEAPRPRIRAFPRGRQRAHRPGATRRTSSSSRTSTDPPAEEPASSSHPAVVAA